jgi:PAS domain S-box-containing protein
MRSYMHKMISSALYVLVIIYAPSLSGQNHIIDSLRYVAKKEKDDTNKVKTLNILSGRLYRTGRYDTAMVCANTAADLAQTLDFKKGVALAFTNMGLIYNDQGNYPKAIEEGLKALTIDEQIGNMNGIANEYNFIGIVYYSQENYNKAMEYFNNSLKINEQSGNKNGIANNYGNLGNIYKSLGNYNKAIECYQKSFILHKQVDNRIGMSNNLGNIGITYETEGKYPEALDYDFRSLQIARENDYESNIESNLGEIGNIYTKLKNYSKAKVCIDSAVALSKNIGEKDDIKANYRYLASLDSATGNYKSGLEDFKMYIIYRDSLINEANTKAEMSLEFEQKQAVQKTENDKKDTIATEEKERQIAIRNSFIVAFVLIFIVVLLLLNRYRTKEKTAALLEEQNRIINDRNIELERLSIVASETENVILIMDADGTVEWVNESFSRMNGMTVDELKRQKGNTIYEISNNPEIRTIINAAVKEKRTMVYESLNLNKEGQQIWESSTLTPIFDEAGKLKKIIIIDTDITARKNAEEIIKQKNKDITDSIQYAKRLQDAIIPPVSEIKQLLPESFVLYKPKDIVAGDFYWVEKVGGSILIAAADCTGHGVPGALVSVVCSNALNRAVREFHLSAPGEILDKVRELVVETFSHSEMFNDKSDTIVQDGMDISLAAIGYQGNNVKIKWSGANNPLWYVQDGQLKEIAANKQPIGKYENEKPFTTHTLTLKQGDSLYLFTDGYADQFGGDKGKKFKPQQLNDILKVINVKNMDEQRDMLANEFEKWKGNLEQVDDVCIIGIRL